MGAAGLSEKTSQKIRFITMLLIVILLATNITTVTIFAIPDGTYTVQNRESGEIYLTRQYFSHKNAMISLSIKIEKETIHK